MEVDKRISEVQVYISELKVLLEKHLQSGNIKTSNLLKTMIKEQQNIIEKLHKEQTCEIRAQYLRSRKCSPLSNQKLASV